MTQTPPRSSSARSFDARREPSSEVAASAKPSAATRSDGATDSETLLRRDDLAVCVSAARAALREKANPRRGVWAVAAVYAAVAFAVLVWYYVDAAGLPAWFSVGAALTIATLFSVGLVRSMVGSARRILRQYQLMCPMCGHDMLDMVDLGGQPTAVDLAVQTGRCAHCGEAAFAP
jgi:Flp pilus assembly protein TadB